MENLAYANIAWDAWRVTHGAASAFAARQRQRLARLLAHTFMRLDDLFLQASLMALGTVALIGLSRTC
jgi:hypothetical protein